MTTVDMVGWVLTQIIEDERVARAAANTFPAGTGAVWRSVGGEYVAPADPSRFTAVAVGSNGWIGEEVGGHIARHDPSRVLAEVEAKRLHFALHNRCDDTCHVLRVIASAYAGQPGYDESWRP